MGLVKLSVRSARKGQEFLQARLGLGRLSVGGSIIRQITSGADGIGHISAKVSGIGHISCGNRLDW